MRGLDPSSEAALNPVEPGGESQGFFGRWRFAEQKLSARSAPLEL